MRVTFVCSECGRRRSAEERQTALGLRCPSCQTFMDPAPAEAQATASLHIVGKGLILVYAALCLNLAVVILVCLGAFAPASWLLPVLAWSILTLLVIGPLLDIVGRLLCLAMPAEDGTAHAFAVLSVLCTLTVLAAVGWHVSALLFSLTIPPAFVQQLQAPLLVIGALLFLLFLRSLALYVGRADLARGAVLVIVIGLATFVAATTLAVWILVTEQPLTSMSEKLAGLILLLVVVVLFFAMLIFYGNLLMGLSRAVARKREP